MPYRGLPSPGNRALLCPTLYPAPLAPWHEVFNAVRDAGYLTVAAILRTTWIEPRSRDAATAQGGSGPAPRGSVYCLTRNVGAQRPVCCALPFRRGARPPWMGDLRPGAARSLLSVIALLKANHSRTGDGQVVCQWRCNRRGCITEPCNAGFTAGLHAIIAGQVTSAGKRSPEGGSGVRCLGFGGCGCRSWLSDAVLWVARRDTLHGRRARDQAGNQFNRL